MVLSLVLSVFSVVPALAANTSDTSWRFTVTGKPSNTEARSKDNNTKVYVYYTVGASETAFQVWGTNGSSGTGTNTTRGTTAYVDKNERSSITNFVNEQGYSNAYLRVTATSEANVGVFTSGVWSPDSTKNYTIVN